MWLKIVYKEEDIAKCPIDPKKIEVSLNNAKTAPIDHGNKAFRLNPIFPLIKDCSINSIEHTAIHFFNFSNAYRILGRIEKKGTDSLKNCVFFSAGLSSVIIITEDSKILSEFRKVISTEEHVNKENASEQWVIRNSFIDKIDYQRAGAVQCKHGIRELL